MLARSLRQQRELVVRYVMGANRQAVVRLQLIQTGLLATSGGALGLLLARGSAAFLLHLQRLNGSGGLTVEWSSYSLAFHWFSVLAAALVIGGLPAWHAAHLNLAHSLSDAAFTHSASRTHARTRRALAALLIALSLVLPIAAGLFIRSLSRLMSVALGFDPDGLTVFCVDPKLSNFDNKASRLFYSNLQNVLLAVPGVQKVTYGSGSKHFMPSAR